MWGMGARVGGGGCCTQQCLCPQTKRDKLSEWKFRNREPFTMVGEGISVIAVPRRGASEWGQSVRWRRPWWTRKLVMCVWRWTEGKEKLPFDGFFISPCFWRSALLTKRELCSCKHSEVQYNLSPPNRRQKEETTQIPLTINSRF